MEIDFKRIAELVVQIQRGDDSAFDELYHLTSKRAFFIAKEFVKNEDDAEDILQDSYIKALAKINELENPETFVSWFNRIVANKSKDYIKKKKPSLFECDEDEAYEVIPDESTSFSPEENADREHLRLTVMQALDELSEDKKACIVMMYYEENSISEIAECLEIPEGTVKTRLYHGRNELKRCFERAGVTSLYSAAPIGIIIWALRRSAQTAQASFAASPAYTSVLAGVKAAAVSTAAAATAAGTATAGTAVAATVTSTTAATAAGGATATGVTAKVVAIAVAGVLVVGGVGAGIKAKKEKANEINTSISTTVSFDSPYDASPLEWFEYEIENDEVVIVSCASEASGMVVIPDKIEGYPVTKIRERCFWDSSEVTGLYIPASVYEIDSILFCFYENKSKIEKIIVSENSADFYSDEYGVLYNKSKTTLLFYPYKSKQKTYVVPEGVTGFSVNAFYFNQQIKSIELPDSVESFPNSLFAQCFNLKYVNIPSRLKTIPSSAFANCTSLQYIAIPSSVKSIEEHSFMGCGNLRFIHFNSFADNIDPDFCKGENIVICSSSPEAVQKMQQNNISCVLCEHSEEDLSYVMHTTDYNNYTEHIPQNSVQVMATMPAPTKNQTEDKK